MSALEARAAQRLLLTEQTAELHGSIKLPTQRQLLQRMARLQMAARAAPLLVALLVRLQLARLVPTHALAVMVAEPQSELRCIRVVGAARLVLSMGLDLTLAQRSLPLMVAAAVVGARVGLVLLGLLLATAVSGLLEALGGLAEPREPHQRLAAQDRLVLAAAAGVVKPTTTELAVLAVLAA
jgi:hypothetical protein